MYFTQVELIYQEVFVKSYEKYKDEWSFISFCNLFSAFAISRGVSSQVAQAKPNHQQAQRESNPGREIQTWNPAKPQATCR